MKQLISCSFLDSNRILEEYYEQGVLDDQRIKKLLFAELYAKKPYSPDYEFKNALESFFENNFKEKKLEKPLQFLSEMLSFRDRKVYVNSERFSCWQDTILSVSPVLIISFAIYKESHKSVFLDTKDYIRTIFQKSTLPSIFEPQLDHLINDGGLNEVHMHLNGSTEPDRVWQDALLMPSQFYKDLKESTHHDGVDEMYLQQGGLEQEDLYRLLKIAGHLRDQLLKLVHNKNPDSEYRYTKQLFDFSKPLIFSSKIHPLKLLSPIESFSSVQYESYFYTLCFEYLHKNNSSYFTYLFHYYLLINSFFQKLLVQQKKQVGFDQFQKITKNDLREFSENKYHERFVQLQGMYDNHLSVLEGRFSPQNSRKKLQKLLDKIKGDFEKFEYKPFDLKLVPHFIKTLDKRPAEQIITFRDLQLRLNLRQNSDVLLDYLRKGHSEFKKIDQNLIVGFDAAANELHASPEVFSPVFRKLAFLGFNNFTYHAGEDFVHLISGVRAVYEAVEFLEMSPGNRIGHAIALGIEPCLWAKRSSNSITIKQGEWLDNLIFVYDLASRVKSLSFLKHRLEQPIYELFTKVYAFHAMIPIYQMVEAWMLRKYDPFIFLNWREPSIFDGFEQKEISFLIKSTALELYRTYHSSPEAIKNYDKFIDISPCELFEEQDLRAIQNSIVEHLNDRNIAIETLPTSNVRISHYKSHKEHHIQRWLGYTNSSDPRPTIILGSDDTGIFMTNLRNEYVHLYQLVESITDKDEAIIAVKKVIENSKAFTFKY